MARIINLIISYEDRLMNVQLFHPQQIGVWLKKTSDTSFIFNFH